MDLLNWSGLNTCLNMYKCTTLSVQPQPLATTHSLLSPKGGCMICVSKPSSVCEAGFGWHFSCLRVRECFFLYVCACLLCSPYAPARVCEVLRSVFRTVRCEVLLKSRKHTHRWTTGMGLKYISGYLVRVLKLYSNFYGCAQFRPRLY
jgi:hypothetical protein